MTPHTFDLVTGPALLRRTPAVLQAWLLGLPDVWLRADEGPQTWSPPVVVGHLIEGEKNDWIPRVRHLFAHGDSIPFTPFDRFAQLREPPRPLEDLLAEFSMLRARSLDQLAALRLEQADFLRRGCHPKFGPVTLGELLATWVAHDLSHIQQLARVMAVQLREAVGPWKEYLRILGGGAGT